MGVIYRGLKRAEFLDAYLELTATRRAMSKRFEDIYKEPIVEAKEVVAGILACAPAPIRS